MQDYDDEMNVYIPKFDESFICIIIPNKRGDNSVILTNEDCKEFMGKRVSMKWIAEKLKRKWAMKISPTSTV